VGWSYAGFTFGLGATDDGDAGRTQSPIIRCYNETMKKRTRVIWVAALAYVLLVLVGAAFFWPSEPYRFLEGARVDEARISTEPTIAVSLAWGRYQEMFVRRYFVQDIGPAMSGELEADGWSPSVNWDYPDRATLWFRSGRSETVEFVPLEHSGGFVTITTIPTTGDRFQAWLWRLTHGRE
jgi:hypothetical protein